MHENPFAQPSPKLILAMPEQATRERFESLPLPLLEDMRTLGRAIESQYNQNKPYPSVDEIKDILREYVQANSHSKVWNALILSHYSQTSAARLSWENISAFSMLERAQANEHRSIANAEKTRWSESNEVSLSFGMNIPSYRHALEGHEQELAQKDELHTMLLGCLTRNSGNEFGAFSKSLNPHATPIALDIVPSELRHANPNLVHRLQADATQLPVANNSQDLIFTDHLLPYLFEHGLPSGEKIVDMLRSAYSALAPGGMLVMSDRAPVEYYDATYSDSLITAALLQVTLEDLGMDPTYLGHGTYYTSHFEKTIDGRSMEQVYIDPKTGRGIPHSLVLTAVKR